MNWKEELKTEFEAGNYIASVSLLRKNLRKGIDVKDTYLCLIYVYLEIIVESKLTNHFSYIPPLRQVFLEAFSKYENCANFLFYVAYMASAFGEMFLGLKEIDVMSMFKKCVVLSPSNLLYQWGNNIYECSWSKSQKKDYACRILNTTEYLDELRNRPLLCKDLLRHLEADATISLV